MSEVEPTAVTRSGPVPAPDLADGSGDGNTGGVGADAVVDLLVEEVSIDGMCGVY